MDTKADARGLAVRHDRMLVVHDHAPVDLLAVPPYLSTTTYIGLLVEAVARVLWGGQALRSVAHEAFTTTYQKHAHPSWQDILRVLDDLLAHARTADRRTAITNLVYRLRRLIERYEGLTAVPGVPAHLLCEHSVLFSFFAYTDLEDLLVTLFIQHLFHHHRAHEIRSLRTVISFDEVLLAFRDDKQHIAGNPLVELEALTREYGIGWLLAANTASELPPSLLANAFALLALNVNSSEEAALVSRTCGFTKRQSEYFRFDLTKGQLVARLGDRWRKPLLARFDPWPYPKTVDPGAWKAACDRIKRLLPPTPDVQRLLPPKVAEPLSRTPRATRIALAPSEETLLRDIAKHPMTLTTPAYNRCELHWMQGDRAKQHLIKLGFLQAYRVTTGKGRGKMGSALRLTPAGYRWLGTNTPGTRGGDSAEHSYLIHELSRRIPDSVIELRAGEKHVDLGIPYNTAMHASLVAVLQRLAAAPIALNDGDVLAIEVEASDARTLAPNAVQNHAAGLGLTVHAVLPNLLKSARMAYDRLPRDVRACTLLVDVFALLEAL
jgi:hypothetical protein